jgi:COP9 signalosome complex subunit 7
MLLAESRSRIEAFELLAKSAKGAASVDLIAQATSAPPLFYFGELLQNPGINDVNFNVLF